MTRIDAPRVLHSIRGITEALLDRHHEIDEQLTLQLSQAERVLLSVYDTLETEAGK